MVCAGGIFVALLGTMYGAAAADGADRAISLRMVSAAGPDGATESRPRSPIPAGQEVPEEVAAILEAESAASEDLVDPSTGVRVGPLTVRPAREPAEPAATSPTVPAPRARSRRSRRPPPVSVPRLHADPGRHVVATARAMIAGREAINGSCHRYLTEVFERAGHGGWRTRRVVYQEGRNGPYADLDLIRPGDWLYIVNHPHRDPVGTHSVLFVGWQDRAAGYAHVIEHPGWGAATTGRERTYDVSRTYRITRPVLER